MEPETQNPLKPPPPYESGVEAFGVSPAMAETESLAPPQAKRGMLWVFIGPNGVRAGWSVVLWLVTMTLLIMALGFIVAGTHLLNSKGVPTPKTMFFSELITVMALLGSVTVVARVEGRRVVDYNLAGTRRVSHFFAGIVIGFLGLSALVGALAAGGWLHFGGVALSGTAIFKFALIWGAVFLLVGCTEEGIFRCYLQATLARGINFWWALGSVAVLSLDLILRHKGNGARGDYALALLGLLPCFWLHLKRRDDGRFWQAAWVTSTLFGFVHTSNGGENWIGIFAAGAIGFVFCVSVWLTGSAWWAIGAHVGWDWAETFFYGTPDSGVVATGHYLSTTLGGNPLWSGGTDGPEGSLLVLGIILLMLVWLLAMYRRSLTSSAAGA